MIQVGDGVMDAVNKNSGIPQSGEVKVVTYKVIDNDLENLVQTSASVRQYNSANQLIYTLISSGNTDNPSIYTFGNRGVNMNFNSSEDMTKWSSQQLAK